MKIVRGGMEMEVIGRITTCANFVTVLKIDTEYESYLIREKQHVGLILRSGMVVNGVLIGKNIDSEEIYISTSHGITIVPLGLIKAIC